MGTWALRCPPQHGPLAWVWGPCRIRGMEGGGKEDGGPAPGGWLSGPEAGDLRDGRFSFSPSQSA